MTLIAALFWPALLASAIWLRRTAPYLLFGAVFFLVGHLLESTFVGLELYFAHRNYVPAFGLYFALVYAAAMVPSSLSSAWWLRVSVVYAFLFAAVLFQVTSGWGQPRISAERWVIENPDSERAAQFLANQYLQEGNLVTAQTDHRRGGGTATSGSYHPDSAHAVLRGWRSGIGGSPGRSPWSACVTPTSSRSPRPSCFGPPNPTPPRSARDGTTAP